LLYGPGARVAHLYTFVACYDPNFRAMWSPSHMTRRPGSRLGTFDALRKHTCPRSFANAMVSHGFRLWAAFLPENKFSANRGCALVRRAICEECDFKPKSDLMRSTTSRSGASWFSQTDRSRKCDRGFAKRQKSCKLLIISRLVGSDFGAVVFRRAKSARFAKKSAASACGAGKGVLEFADLACSPKVLMTE
jgi:hypothetical protein